MFTTILTHPVYGKITVCFADVDEIALPKPLEWTALPNVVSLLLTDFMRTSPPESEGLRATIVGDIQTPNIALLTNVVSGEEGFDKTYQSALRDIEMLKGMPDLGKLLKTILEGFQSPGSSQWPDTFPGIPHPSRSPIVEALLGSLGDDPILRAILGGTSDFRKAASPFTPEDFPFSRIPWNSFRESSRDFGRGSAFARNPDPFSRSNAAAESIDALIQSIAEKLVNLDGANAKCGCTLEAAIKKEKRRRGLLGNLTEIDKAWITQMVRVELQKHHETMAEFQRSLTQTVVKSIYDTPSNRLANQIYAVLKWIKWILVPFWGPFWLAWQVITFLVYALLFVVYLIAYPFGFLFFSLWPDWERSSPSKACPHCAGSRFGKRVRNSWGNYTFYFRVYNPRDYERTSPWTAQRIGNVHRTWWNAFTGFTSWPFKLSSYSELYVKLRTKAIEVGLIKPAATDAPVAEASIDAPIAADAPADKPK